MKRGRKRKYTFGLSDTEIEKKIAGVYMIRCKINNKVYIGISDDIYNRWKAHARSMNGLCYGNKFLVEDALIFGFSNFEFTILQVCKSKFDAYYNGIESEYISKFKSNKREYGYNILEF